MLMNRISKKLGIKGLKGRIILFYIIFSLILATVIFSPMMLIGKKQRLTDAESEMNKVIHLQKTIIDNWLEEHIIQLQTIAEIPMMSENNKDFINSVIAEILDNHPDFHTIAFANEKGIVQSATSGITRVDISERDYFKEAKKGNPYISDVFFGQVSQERIVSFSAPVLDDDHQFKGVLVGSVKLETISEVMSSFLDDSTVTFLTDRNGKLITNSRKSGHGSETESKIFRYAKEGKKLDQFYQSDADELVIGNYVWLHNDRWLIIGETNKSEIFAPFNRMVKIFSTGYAVLTLIGLLLIFGLFKQIKGPIERVLEGTRNIGKGKWGFRIVESPDDATEFSELSHNFNSMADLIEDHVISLAESEEKFRTITEYSSDIISIHEKDGVYIYISPAGKEILQYEAAEMLGQTGNHLVHEDDVPHIYEQYKILDQTGYVVMTYRIRRKDGAYVWLESSLKRLESKDKQGAQMYVISRNVTERKNAEEQLKEANRILENISARDGLTSVLNRRTFDGDFKNMWHDAIQSKSSVSLIMLDVDYFKNYNDTFGHMAGDDCLIKLANILEHKMKKYAGKVYRYGGEEFVLLLENFDQQKTYDIADEIRKEVERLHVSHENNNEVANITVSIGVNVASPTLQMNRMLFLNDTDDALYMAKKSGRNQVVIYEGDREEKV